MEKTNEKLVVLWTSGDKEVATKMVMMYTLNAKLRNWWQEVTLIVWGPSSKLLSQDTELQDTVKSMLDKGIEIRACRACAHSYGVEADLEALGIEVDFMGEPLTDYLKSDAKVMTF